jgi:hypothetical protein
MAPELGRLLFVLGLVVAAIGLAAMLGIRLPLGSLPGDISIRTGNVAVYIPLGTSLLLSILLTLLLSLLAGR